MRSRALTQRGAHCVSASATWPRTRILRKSDAPFFIDKMPNNCLYVGLIHLMLPNARIIDARRHPLGCCFSCFKQHFARGQNFTYGLEDIGRYYRDYVELMAHFDAVLPGRVHRVLYETLIEDTEARCAGCSTTAGCRSRPGCLRFYENERAVRTASSEQVRQPIFREGLDQWRHYEPWLEPLKAAWVRCSPPIRVQSPRFFLIIDAHSISLSGRWELRINTIQEGHRMTRSRRRKLNAYSSDYTLARSCDPAYLLRPRYSRSVPAAYADDAAGR